MHMLYHQIPLIRISINLSWQTCLLPLVRQKAIDDTKLVPFSSNRSFRVYTMGLKQPLCPLEKHRHLWLSESLRRRACQQKEEPLNCLPLMKMKLLSVDHLENKSRPDSCYANSYIQYLPESAFFFPSETELLYFIMMSEFELGWECTSNN